MANNLTTNDGAIETGLRADVMRLSMENKNLLSNKDSIYVGTGNTTSVNVGGSTITIPTTKALEKGSDNTVLSVTGGNLGYNKVNPDMVQTGVTYNITSQMALNCENASRASFSYVADIAAYPAVGGEPSGETIETRFNDNTAAVSSLTQRVAHIETMMNQGDQLVNEWGLFKFSIVVDGKERDIAAILFSPYTSVRYYNSCFLEGMFTVGQLPEESDRNFEAEYKAFSRFYLDGETIEIVGAFNNKVNFLPAQDIEFYFTSPNVYVNYSERIHSDYSDSVLWCNIKIYPTYILKIKTNGNISLQVLPLFVSQDSSSHSSLGYDYYELRKHDDAVHGTSETIKIGYVPKINS